MAMWHLMMGFGLGLFATILTIVVNTQQNSRRIQCGKKSNANYISPPGDKCPICQYNMSNEEMKYLCCGHAIHEVCFKQLKQHKINKCPLCKKDFKQ